MGMSEGHGATLTNATYTNINPSPTNSSGFVKLDSDGSLYKNAAIGANGLPEAVDYVWRTGTGPSSAYEARATETSGTVDSGTVGSWVSLGSDQTWAKNRTSDAPGTNTCTITLEIRDAVTLVVYASASITLTAEVT